MPANCPQCRDHGKTERHADHAGPKPRRRPEDQRQPISWGPAPRPRLTPAQRRAAVLLASGYDYFRED